MKLPHNLENILFLDIETVPEQPVFKLLNVEAQQLFAEKTAYKRSAENISPEDYYLKAGIWAEFGKIVCISIGLITPHEKKRQCRIRSFYGDELTLLIKFKELLDRHFSSSKHRLCAHNGKEFDFPFIARRMLKHQLGLPAILQLMGKKPWEIPHLDTLDLWRFGDYKHYTSLALLSHFFDIPSPKDDISGADVAKVYYEEKNIERIVHYCEKDVVTLAQVYLKLSLQTILTENEIVYVD